MSKIIFYLPTMILNRVFPCLRLWYRPSTEQQRELSQQMRNEARLASYRLKKIITPN
jgi:hypothetical protein